MCCLRHLGHCGFNYDVTMSSHCVTSERNQLWPRVVRWRWIYASPAWSCEKQSPRHGCRRLLLGNDDAVKASARSGLLKVRIRSGTLYQRVNLVVIGIIKRRHDRRLFKLVNSRPNFPVPCAVTQATHRKNINFSAPLWKQARISRILISFAASTAFPW